MGCSQNKYTENGSSSGIRQWVEAERSLKRILRSTTEEAWVAMNKLLVEPKMTGEGSEWSMKQIIKNYRKRIIIILWQKYK